MPIHWEALLFYVILALTVVAFVRYQKRAQRNGSRAHDQE
jgi:hypothetical protein